jgi:hypothetical protein
LGDDRTQGNVCGESAAAKSAMKLTALARNPILETLKKRLRDLALEARVAANQTPLAEADVRRAETDARIAQTRIFFAMQDERRDRLPLRYERLRELREWRADKSQLFNIDFVVRLVRIESLRLGIGSRRHSNEEAIEASVGIKFSDLPSIERRAVEIVLGHRRAANSNKQEPASRIAKRVRREWITKVTPVRQNKGRPLSISSIVRIAIPILDQLAGEPIPSGIPTDRDLDTMRPVGMAVLFAIVKLTYGEVFAFASLYEAVLDFRKEQSDGGASI